MDYRQTAANPIGGPVLYQTIDGQVISHLILQPSNHIALARAVATDIVNNGNEIDRMALYHLASEIISGLTGG